VFLERRETSLALWQIAGLHELLESPHTGSAMSAEKKAYPLRISSDVLDAVQRWGEDDLRSVNAQIEYLLRDALRKAGRIRKADIIVTPVDEPKTS
jgi:hypothetical protein